ASLRGPILPPTSWHAILRPRTASVKSFKSRGAWTGAFHSSIVGASRRGCSLRCREVAGMTQARAFSHVGITVPDLDKAVDFYTSIFGWYLIMKPTEVIEDNSAIGIMCKDVFGEGFGRFRIAHMSTSDK